MASAHVGVVLRQIRQLIAGQGVNDPPDQQLLERFVAHREESAFEALLRRHGPMVYGVCRRVLGRGPDAEDAFQATFLIFTRGAKTIRKQHSVGSWLHGVAHRVALRSRAEAARQRSSARRPPDLSTERDSDDITWRELRAVLDEEMARLSERHRAPLVLCYLESLTQDEAARRLGWSKSTLRRRLEAGRLLLRTRLARRGVTLPAALFATLLAEGTSRAAIPAGLFKSTVAAAFAAGPGLTGLSANALLLAREGLPALVLPKLKLTAILVLAVGLSAGAGALLGHRGSAIDARSDERSKQGDAEAKPERKPGVDHYGDVLPDGAIARLGTVRFNHGDGLDSLHFTPNGKMIVSAGGGLMRLWDAANGKELGQIPATKSSWDDATVISSDGKTVICLGQEFAGDTLRVWDLAQRKEVLTAQLPVRRRELSIFRRNALSRDGLLAVVHTPTDLHVFDIEKAKELCRLPLTSKEIQAAVFAGNDRVVTAFKKQTIEVWDARSGKSVRQFAHGAPVEILAASPDGRRLATLEHQNHAIDKYLDKDIIHLWDLTTGQEKHQLAARPKRWYMNLLFTPDSKRLLSWCSGGDGFELTVWSAETGERLHELRGAVGQHMAVSPDGARLAAGSNWGKFGLFDLKNGERLSSEVSHDLQTAAVSLSPRGDRVLTTGYGSISTWEVATGRRQQFIELPGQWSIDPYRIHSPDLRFALSLMRQSESNETHVLVWDVASGKRLHSFRFPDQWAQLATAFSPDSSLVAIWQPGKETGVHLWEVRTGKEARSFKEAKAGWPGHLFFTADGKTLIVAGKRTAGYDVANGKELFSWRLAPLPDNSGMGVAAVGGAPADPQERLAWRRLVISSEGTLAACILDGGFSRDPVPNRIALCDARTGRVIRRWSDSGKPSNGYEELAFSDDGRLLASSDGNAVHLWEVLTGKELRTFHGHRGEIRSLAFSANGRRLASSSNDSTVVIWDLVPAREAKAKGIAGWWDDLAGEDVRRAYAAVWRLAESAGETVPFLRRHLRPIPEPDAKRIRQFIDELDSSDFAVREKASAELAKLGELAAPALRAALAGKPALEVRRRVEKLLEQLTSPTLLPEKLRALRAIGALEHIGTPEARQVLKNLAEGAGGAHLTQEATAALERLGRGDARE